MSNDQTTPWDSHRLAATFVKAAHEGDDGLVGEVLDLIDPAGHGGDPAQLHGLLIAMAGMVEHALGSTPAASIPAFIEGYRRVLDKAEQLASGPPEN